MPKSIVVVVDQKKKKLDKTGCLHGTAKCQRVYFIHSFLQKQKLSLNKKKKQKSIGALFNISLYRTQYFSLKSQLMRFNYIIFLKKILIRQITTWCRGINNKSIKCFPVACIVFRLITKMTFRQAIFVLFLFYLSDPAGLWTSNT